MLRHDIAHILKERKENRRQMCLIQRKSEHRRFRIAFHKFWQSPDLHSYRGFFAKYSRYHFDLYMNNREIFTPEERKENIERKSELIKLVASREAVLIVGAGSSKRVGYPDWYELLKELEDLACKCGGRFKPNPKKIKDELLEYAEDIKSHICKQPGGLRKYHAMLERLFEPRNLSPDQFQFHKTLVTLPFKGILTTNYDVVLEEALKAIGHLSAYENSLIVNKDTAGQVHRFFLAMNAADELAVAHLHGKYDNPTNIILSIEDYEKAYNGFVVSKETSGSRSYLEFLLEVLLEVPFPEFSFLKPRSANQGQWSSEWTLHRKLLWAVLATRRVVFVGFSMTDPYFKKMLETVTEDLWRGSKPIHFAIRGVSPDSAEISKGREEAGKLKRDCGVETLFYTDANGEHEGLVDIVNEIAEECGVEIPSTVVSQDLSDDKDRSEGEQQKPIASKSGDKLDRTKQMSRRMARRIGDGD